MKELQGKFKVSGSKFQVPGIAALLPLITIPMPQPTNFSARSFSFAIHGTFYSFDKYNYENQRFHPEINALFPSVFENL